MKQSHMSRTPRLKRDTQTGMKTIASLLLLSGAFTTAQLAYAGEYVLDRIETKAGTVYESTSNPTTRPWTGTWPNSAAASKSNLGSYASYSVHAKSKGDIRAVFKWQPQDPNDPNDKPDEDSTLYVKVTSYMNVPASISYGNPQGALSGLVVNNGFGAPITNTNYGTSYNYTSQGTHLVAVKTFGNLEVAIPYVTMHGEATLTGTTGNTYSSTASVGAYPTYSAEKTDKGVLITSSIEDSWKKVTETSGLPTKIDRETGMILIDTTQIHPDTPWNGPGPWRVKCVRAPDGSMMVHSAAMWFEPSHPAEIVSNTNAWFGRGIYDSNATGFMHPLFDWQVSGGTVVGSHIGQFGGARHYQPSITLEPALEDGDRAMRGLKLGGDHLGVGMTGGSTISVKVTDTDGATAKDDYGVTWHLPAEWKSSKKGPIQWDAIEPESIAINSNTWVGHLEGSWKYKTVFAGDVPGAKEAYEDAAVEAWASINDVFGISESAEGSVDDAIKKIKEPRLRLLVGFAKAAGKAYGGQLLEQAGPPPDQTLTADFKSLWNEYGNTDAGGSSEWKDQSDAIINRPLIDFDLLSRDRQWYVDNDPSRLAEFDSQKTEIEKWTVKDPVLKIEKERYLFRGDGYDNHGYEGPVYKGVDTFTGRRRLTATFVGPTPPPPPTPPQGG
jgi:hypothetical protein